MKLLTISIAAYNVGKFLKKTLDSLCCNEEIRELVEVLVQDDGSNDDTFEIARQYEEKYPTMVKAIHKENGGYGSTINNSIRMATGKYFKQLDGDDWFATENMVGFIRWLEEQNADFIITPYYNCYEGGIVELIDNCSKIPVGVNGIEILNLCDNFAMHELAIKTEILKQNNIVITENCFYTDNEYTFLPLFYAKSLSKYEYPIYCYRLGRDGQSVSLEGVKKHYKDSERVAKKMYKMYIENIQRNSAIKPILEKKLQYITDTVYTYYMISTNHQEGKIFLKQFDEELRRKYQPIYEISGSIKKVLILRKTNFFSYQYIRRKVLEKWK